MAAALGAIYEHGESSPSTPSPVAIKRPTTAAASEEVDLLRRERELLLRRIAELESDPVRVRASSSPPSSASSSGGGIVHSVHIRTSGSSETEEPPHPHVPLVMQPQPHGHGVNIEIRHQQQQHRQRYSHPSPRAGGATAVSVVNLRSSTEALNETGKQRARSAHAAPSSRVKLLPGRMAGPPSATITALARTATAKSRSVENLLADPSAVLGLKSANSEMNVMRTPSSKVGPSRLAPRGLRGATSELNMSRIGTRDKVRVDALESIASMPAELLGGQAKVKPNRDKIRQVLAMDSVIDLQRQLLTTVMENEVNPDLICGIFADILYMEPG